MLDGMNFFIYKTKMGLIFNFVKKRSPTKRLFCTSFFGYLLSTVRYCSKLCTDKFMGTMLLSFDGFEKNRSKRTIRAGDISNLVFKYQTLPSSGGIEY